MLLNTWELLLALAVLACPAAANALDTLGRLGFGGGFIIGLAGVVFVAAACFALYRWKNRSPADTPCKDEGRTIDEPVIGFVSAAPRTGFPPVYVPEPVSGIPYQVLGGPGDMLTEAECQAFGVPIGTRYTEEPFIDLQKPHAAW